MLIQRVEDTNREQSSSSTIRTETIHRLSYSVTRVIGVAACQSVNAVCHCFLSCDSCAEVTGPISCAYSDRGQCMSKKMARLLSSVHVIYTWPATCAGPVCVQQLGLTHCTFCVIFCGLIEVIYFLITVMRMQLLHVLHMQLVRLTPQCHAHCLV